MWPLILSAPLHLKLRPPLKVGCSFKIYQLEFALESLSREQNMTSDHCAMEGVQALPQTTSGTDASTEKMGLIFLQSLQPVLESGANW